MTKRRALLQGGHYEIRPPWAIELASFFKACTGCNECMEVCPTTIINKDRFGYPLLDFSKGECLFCQKCVTACPTEALILTPKPWDYVADIKSSCLSFQGTLCCLCGDACEERAISFKPQLGGMAPPVIGDSCTGCGACVSICPVQAIFIK